MSIDLSSYLTQLPILGIVLLVGLFLMNRFDSQNTALVTAHNKERETFNNQLIELNKQSIITINNNTHAIQRFEETLNKIITK